MTNRVLTSPKEGQKTMDNDTPVAVLDPTQVYSSLSEYCAEKGISPATYYRRVKAGKGPRTVKIGVMRAILRDDAAD
jgi:predicted DNA-binding transcriptional regulator AlpA